jgi:YbbR domain-containing protein
LKVLALAISFSLWSAYTAQPFAEITYVVPIAFVNVPTGLDIAKVPAGVSVRIRGRAGLLSRFNASDLAVNADLSNSQAGDKVVSVKPDLVAVPYGVTVVRVNPAEFHVTLVPSSAPTATSE